MYINEVLNFANKHCTITTDSALLQGKIFNVMNKIRLLPNN